MTSVSTSTFQPTRVMVPAGLIGLAVATGLMLIMLRHELALGGIRHVAASTPEVDRGLLFKEQPAEPSQASVGSATLRRSGA
jgi:hypothetical protein